MAEDKPVQIAQISFFMAKPGRTFETVLNVDKTTQRATTQFDFEFEGEMFRFLYFETVSRKSNPPWLEFVNDRMPRSARVAFAALSKNPNGVLLIKIDDQVFAACFGRSASTCLDDAGFEPDFGIKTAMNLCGNEEIRQTRSQSNTITPTQIDRQVGKPADAFTFGLSEAEDLRYISAHIPGNKNVTLQGRNNLTIKVIGQNKLTWSLIVAKCREFRDAFHRKDFATLFPNYKNFRQASPEELTLLDAALLERLSRRQFELIALGVPEFVLDEEYSFTYSNNKKRENTIYSFLSVEQLDEHFDLDKISIEKLKAKHIFAYSSEEDRVLPYRRWRLYNCLVFEQKLNGKYFVLSDGRWLEVDGDFYRSILDFAERTLDEQPCEVAYANIDISDMSEKRNKESIFNSEVCRRLPSAILFDRAKLRIGGGRADKEFCDILDKTDAGVVRIIHCKPYKDSSSTNYLFAQASLYSAAFLRDQIFLTDIRSFISSRPAGVKEGYLSYIAEHTAELNGRDYDVCLWLLYDNRSPKPERTKISIMALYELKLMYEHLRNILKFRRVVLRFVPVRKVQFTTRSAA
ncbi:MULTISPECIES: DUF6119 family protein [unclassified Bradyrhizobium]|uniref:DUF6119 family protein n=1 Tax=unclassified Bradyrhizobium TaxID=2631580 RepID=UPI002915DB9F|nr:MULTISPECIES: DUF6119 family protein [unclassified Bradyrhizobium]